MNSISDIRFNIVPPMPKQTDKPSNNVLVINVVEVENDENYPLNKKYCG